MRFKPIILLLGLTSLLILLASCNVQLRVVIDVEQNGSGEITAGVGLDAVARDQAVFQDLENILQTFDLADSGWNFQSTGRGSDGRDWFEAKKSFSNSEELQAALNQLTSSSNTFTGWVIQIDSSEKKRAYSVVGNVDLTEGFEIFTDQALTDLLEEPPLGIPRETLEENLGEPLENSVDFRIVINLPDDSDGKTFDIPLGEQRIIEATGGSEHRVAQILDWVVWALVALLILAVLLAVINLFLDFRYEKKRPQRRPTPVARQIPGVEEGTLGTTQVQNAQLQLLVIDIHGIIFKQGQTLQDHLHDFIESNGGTITLDELSEIHREGTLGRLETREFWEQAGVDGNADELDQRYIKSFKFQVGAKDFLRNLHKRGIAVAVVTNDFAAWSYGLRDMYGLQGITPWIVSAETGVRKPDPAAFEILNRASGCGYESCLVLDQAPNLLDTASALGMKTVQFTPQHDSKNDSSGHPKVKRFTEFFRR